MKKAALLTLVVLVSLLIILLKNRKETVYIHFENIPDYSYQFIDSCSTTPGKVILKQSGQLWYMFWELQIDTAKIQTITYDELREKDFYSQYWIINNFNGFAINFDEEKLKKYKFKIVRFEENSVQVLPVKSIHFIIE